LDVGAGEVAYDTDNDAIAFRDGNGWPEQNIAGAAKHVRKARFAVSTKFEKTRNDDGDVVVVPEKEKE
jgi:hypothetical protein